MERRDPYRILQIQPDADPDVVRAAYRVLARKAHPDASAPLDADRGAPHDRSQLGLRARA